jgi:hypothetical protein
MSFKISRRRALVVFAFVEIGKGGSLEKFGVGGSISSVLTVREASPDRLTAVSRRLDLIGRVGKPYTSRAGKRPRSGAAEMNQIIERPCLNMNELFWRPTDGKISKFIFAYS